MDIHDYIELNYFNLQNQNQEVNPHLLFNILLSSRSELISYMFTNLKPNTFVDALIKKIESNLYFKKYYGEDKGQIIKFKERFLSSFSSPIQNSHRHIKDTIEDIFLKYCRDIYDDNMKFQEFFYYLLQSINGELVSEPISYRDFPRFISSANQKDDEIMLKILGENDEKINENQEDKQETIFSFNELIQFYDILSKYTKPFSFPQKLVNLAIKKFDFFLNALQKNSNNDDQFSFNFFCKLDPKSEEFKCFKIILLIKMRLLMMNREMNDFLIVLLQLLIIDQENPQTNEDDHFSFKKFINEILPNVTTRRTAIIKNVLNDQILDFSFSDDQQNDYILTKNGVFKLPQNSNEQIEFDTSKMTEILFNTNEENKTIHEKLKQSNKETSKIAFSNGILYLFMAEDNSIHKVVVFPDEEMTRKEAEKKKKLDKYKEHFEQNQKKSSKKTKKKFNKFEEDEGEVKKEVDLESIQIEIPKYPIVSFASFNNYIRIVQRKNCDNNKLTLLLTNVDLTPNYRINYNVEEAFQIDVKTIDNKFIQTQFEFEIKTDENITLNDVLFSENSMYLLFNDNKSSSSYFQKYLVLDNGELIFAKELNSPFVTTSNSVTKMDNKSFVYNFVPLKNGDEFGASITQFYLPETEHFLREEDNLFLKYSYLQKLSNIIDNCSQFIINKVNSRTITLKKYIDYIKNGPQKNNNRQASPLKLTITADEICSIIKPINSLVQSLEDIKMLIKCIKNESLQRFFIALFIKLTGINFFYETIKKIKIKSKIDSHEMNNYKLFKSFILDLYSLSSSSDSFDSDIMIRESMIFTLSSAGKFLFFHDSSYDELRSLMNQLLYNDHFIFKSLLNFMFSNVSSLYFIDQPIYDKLMEMKDEIDITQLFSKNILLIGFENSFSLGIGNAEFIQNSSPYIKVLFQYIRYIIGNEKISFDVVEYLMTYIFTLPTTSTDLSLILAKELIDISSLLYNRIQKLPGVLENDQEFLKKNQDIKKQEFPHETLIIESEHPYNQEPVPIPYNEKINNNKRKSKKNKKNHKGNNTFNEFYEKYYVTNLSTVDFGNKADEIYFQIDQKSELQEKDIIIINNKGSIHIYKVNNETLNFFYKVESNKIRVAIGRYIKDSQKVDQKFWGVKLTIVGVKSDTSFFWRQNDYLFFYNIFIHILMNQYSSAKLSTEVEKAEKDFQIILNDNIIQGIKLEDIDNYENHANQNQNKKDESERTISRGISRGISYDSEEEFQYDNKLKKDFLNKIITINEENQTPEKRFIDAIYTKTAKKNIIKLNKSTQSILESEHLFAACLFKQLGLITTCINFLQIIKVTKKDEIQNLEFPKPLISLWKKIYSLRNTLFYEYLKSKSNSSSNDQQQPSSYETLIKSVNQKCKMLLYSDPILHFKEKDKIDNESFEEAAKSILSFVTSKIPLSDISKLIDIRKKRLSILKQSDSILLSFFDQNSLFESSKPIFAYFYNTYSSVAIDNCLGVKQSEIESYKKVLGELVLKMTKNIFTQPSIVMISQSKFIIQNIIHLQKSDLLLQTSEIIKEMIERNKSNNSFFNITIGSTLAYILIFICLQTEDGKLMDYVVSLLLDDDIDNEIKVLLIVSIPALIQFTQIDRNHRILDETLIFNILDSNKNNPCIIYSTFYWIAFVFDAKKEKSQIRQDFILKVLEAIGRIFLNKKCSFIDDSLELNLQKKISVLMDFFINLLYNQKDENLLSIIHDILTNKINNFENEKELMITIGLFISFGQNLIPTRPTFEKMNDDIETIGFIKQSVLPENKNLELNEKEIDNILKLHEYLIHSDFMNKIEYNDNSIDQKEITQSILITSFYCFLPIIMQIKNNASILLNEKNIQRTLSIFEFAMKSIPTDLNYIQTLISQLLSKIDNATSIKNDIKFNNSFKFMKSNYGEVIYSDGKENDLIKTNKNYTNVFLCNKPFYFDCETYFEIKVCADNCKDIFIGFINAEENDIIKAFGFGCIGYKGSFCRKSELLSNYLYLTADKIMENDQINKTLIKTGDIIGCYYTPNYTYLTINGQLTPYRISNRSLKLYIPIIIVDHEQFDIEIVRNVSIVDNSDNQFDFLKIDENSESFFTEKDIKSLIQFEKAHLFREKMPFIGTYAKVLPILMESSNIESIDVYPKELIQFVNYNVTIKDIIIDENTFVPKYKVEIVNLSKAKTIIGEYDSRLFSIITTNFYNVVSNINETHLEINDIDMKNLPQQLRNSSNLKSIQQYIIKQVIRNNPKSIAIIMTRYLVYILIDYLRYSKSRLLLDNSKEMEIIIKSLAYSLPTITQFNPTFDFNINEKIVNKYLIFHDEQTEEEIENEINTDEDDKCMKWILFKVPGDSYMFHFSFRAFMKKSESFIPIQFILKLLKELYENTKNNSLLLDEIYYLIKNEYKMESISPLPDSFYIQKDNSFDSQNARFIPIIVSSIPEHLPSVVLADKGLKNSSDKISYFYSSPVFEFYWKYNIKDLENKKFDRNYKLKCGLLNLDFNMDENLLNTPLGYIQIVFNILQSFLDSDYLYENKIEILCNEIFYDILSLKKDILVFPFLESFIISILSINGFRDYLNSDKIFDTFKYLSYNSYNKIYQMDSFPTSNNELPLIFSLYTTLIQTFSDENTIKDKSLLFDKYKLLNDKLFNVLDEEKDQMFVEGSLVNNNDDYRPNKQKKNHRILYILYYYSILLYNKDNLPYPKFLFVHDLIRQHFGGFRTVVTKEDIKKVGNKNQKEIIYKSEVFNNDKDLFCSCKLINNAIKKENPIKRRRYRSTLSHTVLSSHSRNRITNFIGEDETHEVDENRNKNKEIRNDNSYKIFIHQLNDDTKTEIIPTSEELIHVSFPLQILIYSTVGQKELDNNEAFVIDFSPSEEQQKRYFIDNYDEIQEDFNKFIELGKYDNEISKVALTTKSNQENNNNNDNANQDNNNNNNDDNAYQFEDDYQDNNNNNDDNAFQFDDDYQDNFDDDFGYDDYDRRNQRKQADDNVFMFYKLDQIPKEITFQLSTPEIQIKPSIISLRCDYLHQYSHLIESINYLYSNNQNNSPWNSYSTMKSQWIIALSSKYELQDLYMKQVIRPAYSMNTESKFKFINQVFMGGTRESPSLTVVFNRFEQQKFMEKFDKNNKNENNNKKAIKARPLIIQLMEQVSVNSLHKMKVRGGTPFNVTLIGENPIDLGGPGRELFSSLIMELVNDHIGIFTFNPNRQHEVELENKEDMIPNKNSTIKSFYLDDDDKNNDYYYMFNSRFIYAGALFAICFVSDLPQQMKLASFIWEFLSSGTVSIDSIYEIDNNFKQIIKNAENIQKMIMNSSMNEDEFESLFLRTFEIQDSFDNVVELVPSGSKKRVTKENLNDFIELAKNYRIHEFDKELKDLKKGFDLIMCYKNVTSILNPKELELLCCGETNCSVEQMKNLFVFVFNDEQLPHQTREKMIKMFWNVIESFSPEERILLIKFSSGNMGLPSPGVRWKDDIKVVILSKENQQTLAKSHTCFSSVDLPFFESEEQLSKVLKTSINFSGLITDGGENIEAITDFL